MPDLATGAVVFVTGGAAASVEQRPSSSPPKAQHVVVADLDIDGAEDTVASSPARVHQSSSTSPTTRRWPSRSTPLSPSTADSTLRSTTQASTTPRAFHDLDAASWDRMIRVNLSSVFVCMKHELRHMAAAGSGAIVNTSSGAGVVAAPGLPHYTAAKHGVVGLTKAAAQEYARQGIRVNAVLPGSTDTTMLQSFIAGDEGMAKIIASSNIHGRLIEPDEIASAVVWLASPHAGMVNGQSLIVDGGGLVR